MSEHSSSADDHNGHDVHSHSHGGHSHSHGHSHGPTHSHSHAPNSDQFECDVIHSHPSNSSSSSASSGHSHSHSHSDSPGRYEDRDPFSSVHRNFFSRSFTIGIGGPVGSGKTALVKSLCEYLRNDYSLIVVTNDIFTKEDGEFLIKNKALSADRIRAVETGGCPHAAIREDCTANLAALQELNNLFHPDFAFVESGGDNLAANFSRELADFIIYVIDVAGGDKIPRKGGPGITQSDLLVINKTDLAEKVGADLELMKKQAAQMRSGGPTIFAQVKFMKGIAEIAEEILKAWTEATGKAPIATKKRELNEKEKEEKETIPHAGSDEDVHLKKKQKSG